MFDVIFNHFDAIFGVALGIVGIVVLFIAVIVVAFPCAAIWAVKERRKHAKQYRRERFARQRMLQQVVADVAASNRTEGAPPVQAYPEPVEPDDVKVELDNVEAEPDDMPLDDYPDPE